MPTVTVDDIQKIKDSYKHVFAIRNINHKVKIVVHMGTCGIAAGARRVMKAFLDAIKESGYLDAAVSIDGCEGFCHLEPVVDIYIDGKDKVRYVMLDSQKAKIIFDRHVIRGEVVKDFMLQDNPN